MSLLTIISVLDPRNRLRETALQITVQLEKYLKQQNIGTIFITLCFLMNNHSYVLPYKAIFCGFIDVWLKNNKEYYYLLYCIIEEMERK